MTPAVTGTRNIHHKDSFGSHQKLNRYDSIVFYFSRAGLQCCVSFRCTAKRFQYTYTYTHSLLRFFFRLVITEYCVDFSGLLYSRALLTTYLTYSRVCVHPKLLLHPSPPRFPFGIHMFSFSTSILFLPCKEIHLYHFSRFHIYALIYEMYFSFSDLLKMKEDLKLAEPG